jgi:hypothetical protein
MNDVQAAFLDGAVGLGHRYVEDHNRPGAVGARPTPRNARDGMRMSTAVTYLAAARRRPNLAIRPDTSAGTTCSSSSTQPLIVSCACRTWRPERCCPAPASAASSASWKPKPSSNADRIPATAVRGWPPSRQRAAPPSSAPRRSTSPASKSTSIATSVRPLDAMSHPPSRASSMPTNTRATSDDDRWPADGRVGRPAGRGESPDRSSAEHRAWARGCRTQLHRTRGEPKMTGAPSIDRVGSSRAGRGIPQREWPPRDRAWADRGGRRNTRLDAMVRSPPLRLLQSWSTWRGDDVTLDPEIRRTVPRRRRAVRGDDGVRHLLACRRRQRGTWKHGGCSLISDRSSAGR